MTREYEPSLQEILRLRPVYTEVEAALYTNTSVSYLRKGREGTLPPRTAATPHYIKIGRSVRYLRGDLDQWLNSFPKLRNRADG